MRDEKKKMAGVTGECPIPQPKRFGRDEEKRADVEGVHHSSSIESVEVVLSGLSGDGPSSLSSQNAPSSYRAYSNRPMSENGNDTRYLQTEVQSGRVRL